MKKKVKSIPKAQNGKKLPTKAEFEAMTAAKIGHPEKEQMRNYLGDALKFIDPSGISSYPDVARAWGDKQFTTKDITEPLGALPMASQFKNLARGYNTLVNTSNVGQFLQDLYEDYSGKNLDEPINAASLMATPPPKKKNGGNIEMNNKQKVRITGVPKAKDGMNIPKAVDGTKMEANNRWLAKQAAKRHGLPEWVINRLVSQESGGNQGAVSGTGAKSFMQFMPDTATEMGLKPSQLTSNAPEDRYAVADAGVRYLKQQIDNNKGDIALGLAAYNGGQKAVDYVKNQLGKKDITGDEWVNFMSNRRQTSPTSKNSAWQNQTYDYVNNILNTPGEEFYGTDKQVGKAHEYHQKYYTPPAIPVPIPTDPNKETDLGIERIPSVPDLSAIEVPKSWQLGSKYDPTKASQPITRPTTTDSTIPTKKKTSLADRNRLGLGDITGELAALTEQPDYVQHFSYQPEVFQPYQISAQDKLNQNNSSFRAVSQSLTNNPEALATLAAQKYEADNQVLGEQFRTNQAIANDVYNKNVGVQNEANMRNLQLADEQYQRQAQAIANTRARKQQAVTSIGNKFQQKKAENMNIRMAENLFDYRPDKNLQMQYEGEGPLFNFDAKTQFNPYTKTITKIKDDGTKETTYATPSEMEQMAQAQKLRQSTQKADKITTKKYGGLIKKMK